MSCQKFKTNIASIKAIGIDVSKDSLSVSLSSGDLLNSEYLVIDNTENEIAGLAKKLKGYEGKIVVESTGRHHLPSAVALTKHGLDVRVINPLLTQKYSKAAIRKVKTDRQDAHVLAEIALKEQRLPSSFVACEKALNIGKKINLIASIEKQIQQLKATTNDYIKTKEILKSKLSGTEKDLFATIKKLEKQKDKLEQEVEKDINDFSGDDRGQIERFNSIPGVSLYVAALANFFFSMDHLDSAKQWIAFSGLDISVRQSGVWQGRGKLTKRGNPYIRKRLFQAAWGAAMNDDYFGSYYNELKSKGRKHSEALVIIARKLIRIMFSLAKNQTTFELNKASII